MVLPPHKLGFLLLFQQACSQHGVCSGPASALCQPSSRQGLSAASQLTSRLAGRELLTERLRFKEAQTQDLDKNASSKCPFL